MKTSQVPSPGLLPESPAVNPEATDLALRLRANVLSLLDARLADVVLQRDSERTFWRAKSRESPASHALRRQRRNVSRGRLVEQLLGDR
jgi:hypothetical protein